MRTERIRMATEEEILKIADKSDLTDGSRVLARGENLAVWKMTHELDPVFFAESAKPAERYMFMWGLANLLKGSGAAECYFNVPCSSEFDTYRKTLVEHLDAVQVSREPEFRYKVAL